MKKSPPCDALKFSLDSQRALSAILWAVFSSEKYFFSVQGVAVRGKPLADRSNKSLLINRNLILLFRKDGVGAGKIALYQFSP